MGDVAHKLTKELTLHIHSIFALISHREKHRNILIAFMGNTFPGNVFRALSQVLRADGKIY